MKSKSFRVQQQDVLLERYKVMDLELMNSILNDYEDSFKGLNDLIFDLEEIDEDVGVIKHE